MKALLAAYLSTLVAFVGIDFAWLSIMGERLYRPILKDVLLDGFRLAPATVFYLAYVAGLVYFAVRPALSMQSWRTAAVNGALFGFFAYATYDLTNQTTVRNWTTALSAADMAWGTLLSSVAAAIGFAATQGLLGDG
jgi:uncharacterized membrane protein